MDPLNPPVSIVLALWAPTPSSHGLSLVQGPDGVHDVIGSVVNGVTGASNGDGDAPERTGLERWLAGARPLTRVTAVLPSPSGATGTWGILPDVEEGVVIEGGPGRVLLVPEDSGTSVTWRAAPVSGPLPPLDAAHARRQVHAATEEAIDSLVELDLARERPETADALNDLLTAVVDPRLIPPWLPSRNRELLERSLRLAGICELALDDEGAATTALQAQRRSSVLRPLLAVARHGAAAATEWWAR
ncbi:hypothetical protein [Actinomyces sp. ZJ308]|uniref:hypothetical protein n=1 Tax=Actinomyces sp. ZJ308 TaxID=2708342 RepID=UPI001424A806|nr:hypothetical protein [Actinomyces sp. ZJ308]